jgi:hypothetical protein
MVSEEGIFKPFLHIIFYNHSGMALQRLTNHDARHYALLSYGHQNPVSSETNCIIQTGSIYDVQ